MSSIGGPTGVIYTILVAVTNMMVHQLVSIVNLPRDASYHELAHTQIVHMFIVLLSLLFT